MAVDTLFGNFESLIFVFVRVASMLVVAPFFGGSNLPAQLKIGLALVISIIVTPTVGIIPLPEGSINMAIGIMREVGIGVVIGFTSRLVFSAFEMAGQMTGMQMGFAVANVIDPQTNSQLSVVAQFYNLLAILLFFALNIHLAFLTAIKESFEYIAPYTFSLNRGVVEGLFLMAGNIFAIAVKLAAPVMVTILLANIAMGVLARTVPQLNIFVVGFPITIALGLVIVGITLPFAMELIEKVYGELTFSVIDLARSGGR